jgi:seryl-tRNA synthetase
MLDPHLFRSNLEFVINGLSKRGYKLDTEVITELEARRKQLQITTQELQQERNARSKEIGKVKAQGGDVESLMKQIGNLGDRLKASETELEQIQEELNYILMSTPNIPHESVPEGTSEADNKEIRKWGEPPQFDFEPKDHVDLGEALGLIDFEAATRITASRFVVMSGAIARLHRALIQFMLDVHTQEHGYTEINVPYMVNADSMRGTGQLPKFEEDLFAIPQQNFYLIPTAEVPVTNLARDQIIPAEKLPLKYVCHTPCFRSEAGSYGKDTRGMIRQHQFEKVELVQLVKPADSYRALEELTDHAEVILRRLELPYRVVALCGADLGFSSAKTYDIEVWLPGQNKYREISSCSNFEDFQARRMKARWRNPETGKPELLHTLNGSGLAVGRTLIAIVENCQNSDGSIRIPGELQQYMGGSTLIK